MSELKVIVGLGNPGERYVGTRHNVGFMVLDLLAERLGITFKEDRKWEGSLARTPDLVLLKPLTYMNESGRSLASLCRFYRWAPDSALVVLDDIALPLGRLRLRARGSHGGHNGVRSIINHFGTEDFPRLKIGIGDEAGGDLVNHVLGKFSVAEKEESENTLARAADAVQFACSSGLDAAANKFNINPTSTRIDHES